MRKENSCNDKGSRMGRNCVNAPGSPAINVFERYGSCSGIIYTCRIFSGHLYAGASMRCLAWVCMN